MNMAKYGSRRLKQPQNVNFELNLYIIYHICKIQLQKKKWGKKWMDVFLGILPLPSMQKNLSF